MKGTILAGGAGSRLNPLMLASCKRLPLPCVSDKRLITHPAVTLDVAR